MDKWLTINLNVHNVLEELKSLEQEQAMLQNMLNDDKISHEEFQHQIDYLLKSYATCLNNLNQLKAESEQLKAVLGIE